MYEGNPKRSTTRPTAEKLLIAFRGITLYFHRDGSTEISPLNFLQQQILGLMKIPESIYLVQFQGTCCAMKRKKERRGRVRKI